MQPRTMEQVYASLGSTYDPIIGNIRNQQAAIPQQLQADESALQGQQTQAFDNILSSARRRGTGVAFGGIPLGEQAKYNATTFQPAMANLRGSYATKGLSLEEAILGANRDRSSQAQGIFESERNYFEEKRRFDEQMAFERAKQAEAARQASQNSYTPTYTPPEGDPPNNTNNGKPAQKYIGNADYRGHLAYLAQKEKNQDAAIALRYVGNDGKYNLSPYVTNPSIIAALNRIGAVNVYRAPAKTVANTAKPAPKTNQYGGSTAGLARFY